MCCKDTGKLAYPATLFDQLLAYWGKLLKSPSYRSACLMREVRNGNNGHIIWAYL